MMSIFRPGRGFGLRVLAGLALAIALSACGGGGGDSPPEPNLAVNVNYDDGANSQLQVFRKESLAAPNVTGLEGHQPHFAVAPRSDLPEGLTVDPDTGAISGRPTSATEMTSIIRLTVPGFQGYVDSELHFSIAPFWVMYPSEYIGAQRGLPVAASKPFMPSYDDAVIVSFETWPAGEAMPPGMTLDSHTGEIAGTPPEEGSYAIFVVATASYGGKVSQADARVNLLVEPIADVGFVYAGVQVDANQSFRITPSQTLQPGDTLANFRLVSSDPELLGLRVDSVTGVVSGSAPASSGIWNATVQATFTRGNIVETRSGEISVYVN
jgi:large repetitive protein